MERDDGRPALAKAVDRGQCGGSPQTFADSRLLA